MFDKFRTNPPEAKVLCRLKAVLFLDEFVQVSVYEVAFIEQHFSSGYQCRGKVPIVFKEPSFWVTEVFYSFRIAQ